MTDVILAGIIGFAVNFLTAFFVARVEMTIVITRSFIGAAAFGLSYFLLTKALNFLIYYESKVEAPRPEPEITEKEAEEIKEQSAEDIKTPLSSEDAARAVQNIMKE